MMGGRRLGGSLAGQRVHYRGGTDGNCGDGGCGGNGQEDGAAATPLDGTRRLLDARAGLKVQASDGFRPYRGGRFPVRLA
jgi:hypothetical protein